MAKPIHVSVEKDQIIFYSDFIYSELNKTVSPRRWEKDWPAGPGRDRPGAWIYPAAPEAAARLMRSFGNIIERDKNSFLSDEFKALADAGKKVSSLKIDLIHIVKSMSKRCAVAQYAIRIRYPYDPEMVSVFKSIGSGQFTKDPEPAWLYPASFEHAERIREELEAFAGDEYANGEISHEFLTLLRPPERVERAPIKSKRTPRKHQEATFWKAFDRSGYVLGYDMGAGKTKVAIDLCVNRNDKLVLVVCPKAVINVWPKELEKDAAEDYTYTILPLNGPETMKKKAEILAEYINDTQNVGLANHPRWVIVNYDIVYRDDLGEVIQNVAWDCVICDESHKIKSPGAKASAFLGKLARDVPHRLALTGTIMPNAPEDVYAQFRFVDSTVFGSRFRGFTDARGNYQPGFLDDYVARFDDYGKPTAYKNLRQLNAKIYKLMDRVKTSDVIDLPPVQHIEHYFKLSAPAQKAHTDLRKKSEIELDEGLMTAKNLGVIVLRQAQITGGYAKLDDGTVVQVDTGKRELLTEILEGLPQNEPVVVFCRFSKDITTVHEVATALKRGSGELSGRADELLNWQKGDFPVLAVQIQSGGAGVDCTRAAHVIYYSTGYTPGDYEQSLKRADRPGQTRPVRFYHLLAENSVDIDIMQALYNKTDLVEAILAKKKADSENGAN